MRTTIPQLAAAITLATLASLAAAREVEVSADRMTVADGITEFTGEVTVISDDLRVTADHVSHDQDSQTYVITGDPAMLEITGTGLSVSVRAPNMRLEANDRLLVEGGGRLLVNTLAIDATTINYGLDTNLLEAQGGVQVSQGEVYSSEGNTLSIRQVTQNPQLVLQGSPAKISLLGDSPFSAEATSIAFDRESGDLSLTGDVNADYNGQDIRSERVKYNLVDNSFSANNNQSGRVTMIIDLP